MSNTNLEFRNSIFSNMKQLREIDLSNLSAGAAEDASETLLTTNITNFTGFIFENCTALTTVNYPKSIAAIPAYIFKGCSSLNDFNFNDLTNLTSIGTAAFQNSGLSGT
ncbi:MAG: leucine-rich repeat domain-containing protein, partial [Ureaplasma sp.]|nr:leucine-rich repeat domain-containing protein [Ureaplasma sp.]